MTPFPIWLGLVAYFGTTVLTGDTLASALAALFAAVAAILTRRTHSQVGEVPGKDNVASLLLRLIKLEDYQHRRNHDILNLQHRNGLYLWRIGKQLGIPDEEWPEPSAPALDKEAS